MLNGETEPKTTLLKLHFHAQFMNTRYHFMKRNSFIPSKLWRRNFINRHILNNSIMIIVTIKNINFKIFKFQCNKNRLYIISNILFQVGGEKGGKTSKFIAWVISDEVVCMYFHIQCKRENKLKKCAEIDIDEQIHRCNIL